LLSRPKEDMIGEQTRRFLLTLSEDEIDDLMFACRAAMEKVNWFTKNRRKNLDLRGPASAMVERQTTLLKLLQAVKDRNIGISSAH
jgi:hypothetical protein